MRPKLHDIIDRIEELMLESSGELTDEVKRLLDEAWDIMTSDPRGEHIVHSPPSEQPGDLPTEDIRVVQDHIDREILDMLSAKDRELDSISRQRPLADEEVAIRTRILRFKKELEKDLGI